MQDFFDAYEERPICESPCVGSLLLQRILSGSHQCKVVLERQSGNSICQGALDTLQTSSQSHVFNWMWLKHPCCFLPQSFAGSYTHPDLIFVYIFLNSVNLALPLLCVGCWQCEISHIHVTKNMSSRVCWYCCVCYCAPFIPSK